ncbi:MAG: hypothetical protein ACREDR_15270, partial [Blastocatellia bacterium]
MTGEGALPNDGFLAHLSWLIREQAENDLGELMQTAYQTETPQAAPDSSENAVIRVEEIHKYYEMGETRVHA